MTSQFVNSMLRVTLSAALLLPSAAVLGAGCGQADPDATKALGASMAEVGAKPSKQSKTPTAAPSKTAPVGKTAPTTKEGEIDMSYIFKGSAADRAKLKLATFREGMTDEEKLALVKRLSKVVENMQAADAKERITAMPQSVRDGAAVWNNLNDKAKLDALEEAVRDPRPGGDGSNWAAAAVGIAVAAFVYQVAKDEKWINDKDLRDLSVREFTQAQLDHTAALGNSPLMMPGRQMGR